MKWLIGSFFPFLHSLPSDLSSSESLRCVTIHRLSREFVYHFFLAQLIADFF